MLNAILLAFFLWIMYKVIFRFIIPVYMTTKQVRQRFEDMTNQNEPSDMNNAVPKTDKKFKKGKVGEYIEFEEIEK